MSEHQQQAAIVQWFKMQYPQYAGCIIAQLNGAVIGGKNKFALINKMKKEGMKAGTSDLFIAVPSGDKHGLWMEVKDEGKTLCSVSQAQRDHIDLMVEMGYAACWVSGFEAAKGVIGAYMS